MVEVESLNQTESGRGHRFKLSLPVSLFKSVYVQLAFWTSTYFVLLTIFSTSSVWYHIDYLYTGIFMSTMMIAVWMNAYLLIPRMLQQRRYLIYLISVCITIIATVYFNHLLFDKLIDYILPGYYFIAYYSLLDLLKFFGVLVALATLIQLTMEWFALQENTQSAILLQKEKVTAELQALTNQVNPHFLFNSLSVLYSLALRESREAPVAIMQLSDMLKYVIYEASKRFVPLGAEVEMIRNYIGLQRYRVHVSTKIEFLENDIDPSFPVMPMVFLPLIENSFKHGTHSNTNDAFVSIRMKTTSDDMEFSITNNRMLEESPSTGGVGLRNIRMRLDLVYKEKYELNIVEEETNFSVHVKLPRLYEEN
ncbi:histidine kinase [Chryseolinea sp. T2]|uniref:sensor histidine kinase n=1 Tax=Chryseolinea sp. T2 TaxID=3129255 RepID=UPI003076945B